MENSIAIITKKADVKGYIKNLSETARTACDTIFAYAPDIAKAENAVDEARKGYEPMLAENFSKIASDKEGIKKAGFDKFSDFAKVVFGLEEKTASMYKRAGDKFFNVEKRPEVSKWFTISKLQELRNIDNEILDADATSGILRPDMTMKQLREYAVSKDTKSIDSGSDIVKTYTGMYISSGEKFENVDEAFIASAMNGGILPDDDHIHVFKSADKWVIPAKKEGAKDKEKPIFVMVVESDNGNMYLAKYREYITEKPAKNTGKMSDSDKLLAALISKFGSAEAAIAAITDK